MGEKVDLKEKCREKNLQAADWDQLSYTVSHNLISHLPLNSWVNPLMILYSNLRTKGTQSLPLFNIPWIRICPRSFKIFQIVIQAKMFPLHKLYCTTENKASSTKMMTKLEWLLRFEGSEIWNDLKARLICFVHVVNPIVSIAEASHHSEI